MNKKKKITIIYIGGYGRSGSTLLDLILGHGGGLSLGEVRYANRHITNNTDCSCGKPVNQCSVWGNIHTFEKDILCSVIATNNNFNIFIDSSKNTWGDFYRALKLKNISKTKETNVYFIHLIRNPIGVYTSLKKGSNEEMQWGRKNDKRIKLPPILSLFLGWTLSNISGFTLAFFFRKKYLLLNYQDILNGNLPWNKLKEMCLDTESIKTLYLQKKPIKCTHHIIGGNRMARKQSIIIKRNNQK